MIAAVANVVEYTLKPVYVPQFTVRAHRFRTARSALIVLAQVSFLASAMALFDFIPAVRAVADSLEARSFDLIGGTIFTTDIFVLAGLLMALVLLLPVPPGSTRVSLPRFSLIGISALSIASVVSVLVGFLSGHGDLFGENRFYVYGITALMSPIIMPGPVVIRRIIFIFVTMAVLSLLINPEYYARILSNDTHSYLNFDAALAFAAILAAGMAIDRQNRRAIRISTGISFVLLAIGIMYDGSRASYLAISLGMATIALFYFRSLWAFRLTLLKPGHTNKTRIGMLAVTGLALFIIVAVVGSRAAPGMVGRLKPLGDPGASYSLDFRAKGFNQGIKWWTESPLVGKGAGFKSQWNAPLKVPNVEYDGRTELKYASLHNFYVRALVFGGLVGATVFLVPVAIVFSGLFRLSVDHRNVVRSLGITVFAAVVASLSGVAPSIFQSWNSLMVWMALGFGFAVVVAASAQNRTRPGG